MVILITNEYISKLKRYTEKRGWINSSTLLQHETLKQPMIDEKIDDKEAEDRKNFNNRYLDKRGDIMKNTQLGVEAVFRDV